MRAKKKGLIESAGQQRYGQRTQFDRRLAQDLFVWEPIGTIRIGLDAIRCDPRCSCITTVTESETALVRTSTIQLPIGEREKLLLVVFVFVFVGHTDCYICPCCRYSSAVTLEIIERVGASSFGRWVQRCAKVKVGSSDRTGKDQTRPSISGRYNFGRVKLIEAGIWRSDPLVRFGADRYSSERCLLCLALCQFSGSNSERPRAG